MKNEAKQLPHIHIIATGGTIAGAAKTSTQANYKPGQLSVEDILKTVPELENIAHISSEQPFVIASQDITEREWILLANRVNTLLAQTDIDGIVITHGTDTMEETAYFLNLTVKNRKPVILVGAMRPSTSLSPDGPLNLFNAVSVAGDTESIGKGVLIVMDGKILDAHDTTKTHTINVEAFQAPNTGPTGRIFGGKVIFRQNQKYKHTTDTIFNTEGKDSLPKVVILYGYADAHPLPAQALINADIQGIIYAGVGNGNISKNLLPVLIEARKKGIAIVRSSRVHMGPTTIEGEIPDKELGFIVARDLNPQKARILLMLALTHTNDREQLQQYFGEY